MEPRPVWSPSENPALGEQGGNSTPGPVGDAIPGESLSVGRRILAGNSQWVPVSVLTSIGVNPFGYGVVLGFLLDLAPYYILCCGNSH